MIESGIQQKTLTMENTQSNAFTSSTQESRQRIHFIINISSSAAHAVVKQEQRSQRPESDAKRIAWKASPTSPDYSGSSTQEVADASMRWTGCHNDECKIHLGEKQGSGWYSQLRRRSRKPSVAHDHDWRQEMEANPGDECAPQQQPQRRRARRANQEITSWENCSNDNCNDH